MGGAPQSGRVDKTIDVEALIREIQRYLAVVIASRARRLGTSSRERDRKEKK